MKNSKEKKIYIVGAGFAGKGIASEIRAKGTFGKVVAFLDDDPDKIGTTIDTIPVLGPIDEVNKHLKQIYANEALIAIPGTSRETLRKISAILSRADFARIRILPKISQIIDGSPHVIQTREINAQDFLGRNPVAISLKKSLSYLRGKRVLITGAGGSIGGELCRQLLSGGAQRLFLFDHEENSLYEIEKELRILQDAGIGEAATIVPVVGELKDKEYMDFIIRRLRADVIFHCAAYKHVPMLEENPIEAISNNVFGTRNLVEASRRHGVSRFVLISTDKAVDPFCVYGASKMIAEEIVLHATSESQEFMVVRFGNVFDSRGSIVPLFRTQIEAGGPVTVTDPEATRYFMTVPEAASLVLKAGGVGKGGSLYILEMGDPVRILDLAEQMIRFYGFEPNEDIEIKHIGLRPGEKIIETLWSEDEKPEKTPYSRIFKLNRNPRFNGDLKIMLEKIHPICFYEESQAESYRNRRLLRKQLNEFIPTTVMPDNEPEY